MIMYAFFASTNQSIMITCSSHLVQSIDYWCLVFSLFVDRGAGGPAMLAMLLWETNWKLGFYVWHVVRCVII